MKDEFNKYLMAIDVPTPLQKRVDEIIALYGRIYKEPIEDIFVCDYIKEDGSRGYDSLWLFSGRFSMEAKEFVNKHDYDITPNQITYMSLEVQDYDLSDKATLTSRLLVRMTYLGVGMAGISGSLKAARENCPYLKNVLVKHIVSHISS